MSVQDDGRMSPAPAGYPWPLGLIYHLCGRTELERWIAEPVGPMQLRDPLLLKLVFAAEVERR